MFRGFWEELQHPNEEIRSFAARALGAIDDPSAIPALIQALSDQDKTVRLAAAIELGDMRHPSAISVLIESLQYTDHIFLSLRVCDSAATALERIGTDEALAAVSQWRARG